MEQHDKTDIPTDLPTRPELEVWKYEDDIGLPILMGVLALLIVLGYVIKTALC